MNSKVCRNCKIEKPLDMFYKQARGLFGRQSFCKLCRHDVYEVKDKCKEYKSDWLKENKEKANAASKRWRDKFPEKHKKSKQQWNLSNPDKVANHKRTYKHKRRARMKSNGRNDLTTCQIEQLFKDYKTCIYCNSSIDLTLEHLKPISRGGENTLENCAIACSACNSEKGSLGPIEYIRKLMGWR